MSVGTVLEEIASVGPAVVGAVDALLRQLDILPPSVHAKVARVLELEMARRAVEAQAEAEFKARKGGG